VYKGYPEEPLICANDTVTDLADREISFHKKCQVAGYRIKKCAIFEPDSHKETG
jgi:hypothetical protein